MGDNRDCRKIYRMHGQLHNQLGVLPK